MFTLFRLFAVLLTLLATGGAAAESLGIVMMHGKWASPPPWHMVVSNAIKHNGCEVIELNMPWAGSRMYDAPYESAL